jgi:leucyl-tRNA synthetase
VWNFAVKHEASLKAACAGDLSQSKLRKEAAALRREMHVVLKQVSYDYERMQYNTVVSGCMKLLNALEDFKPDDSEGDNAVRCEGVSLLLRLLYPACPHISAKLWAELGYAARLGDVLDTAWPQVDEAALVQDEIELMLQINGKLRGSVLVSASATKEDIEQAALACDAFTKQAQGAAPQKIIVVPGRLVNLVL